jgi:hypothetical protein
MQTGSMRGRARLQHQLDDLLEVGVLIVDGLAKDESVDRDDMEHLRRRWGDRIYYFACGRDNANVFKMLTRFPTFLKSVSSGGTRFSGAGSCDGMLDRG